MQDRVVQRQEVEGKAGKESKGFRMQPTLVAFSPTWSLKGDPVKGLIVGSLSDWSSDYWQPSRLATKLSE